MLFSDIMILDENMDVREHMYVGVRDESIAYIGSEKPEEDFGRVVRGEGKCLMSGFFNAHAHSPMSLMRGYGEDMNLADWLFGRIFPFEEHLDPESVYAGTMLAMAESIKNGIVSTSDMYYFCEDMAGAVRDSGAKANISRSITNMDEALTLSETKAGSEMVRFFEEWNGAAGGRILVDMSLHAEYTNCERTTRELAELTKNLGARMHVHVAETKSETEECRMRHAGLSPVAYLDECGIFDSPATAAHCVWIDDNDIAVLRRKGTSVAVNPSSNLKLASGVCDVASLLGAGVPVAIGTDSVASNNNLNMFEEMKIFAAAPKMYYNNPSEITVKQALLAATAGGARAQGRDDTGIMRTGMKADLVMIDISGPNMHPVHDLASNIVYAASAGDVVMSMVDGNILYENGEYLSMDIEKVIYEADRATRNILAKM